MQDQNREQLTGIITALLLSTTVALIVGFMWWFSSGIISFADKSTVSAVQALQGISGLIETLFASSWSTFIILFGLFIITLMVCLFAKILSQYDEFNPIATIIYQFLGVTVMVSGSVFLSPILVPYAATQMFSGNGDALFGQAKHVAGLIASSDDSTNNQR
jgi:hypothetical protein